VLIHAVSLASGEDDQDALSPVSACPLAGQALLSAADVPTTLAEELAGASSPFPEYHRYAADNMWSDADAATLAPALAAMYSDPPGPRSTLLWMPNAPQPAVPDMAFSTQADNYVALYAAWTDPAEDHGHQSWPAEQMRHVRHLAAGQYLGDADLMARTERFMSDAAWARLTSIREQWDPTGLFAGHLAPPGVPPRTGNT
jgi:hypothetical protein